MLDLRNSSPKSENSLIIFYYEIISYKDFLLMADALSEYNTDLCLTEENRIHLGWDQGKLWVNIERSFMGELLL